MFNEGRKFQISICHIWCRRRMPYLDLSSHRYSEMPSRGGKGERIDLASERKVVEYYATGYVRKNRVAIFVNG
jgi:hypothetical protein